MVVLLRQRRVLRGLPVHHSGRLNLIHFPRLLLQRRILACHSHLSHTDGESRVTTSRQILGATTVLGRVRGAAMP